MVEFVSGRSFFQCDFSERFSSARELSWFICGFRSRYCNINLYRVLINRQLPTNLYMKPTSRRGTKTTRQADATSKSKITFRAQSPSSQSSSSSEQQLEASSRGSDESDSEQQQQYYCEEDLMNLSSTKTEESISMSRRKSDKSCELKNITEMLKNGISA